VVNNPIEHQTQTYAGKGWVFVYVGMWVVDAPRAFMGNARQQKWRLILELIFEVYMAVVVSV
jgi:hypothetical protein